MTDKLSKEEALKIKKREEKKSKIFKLIIIILFIVIILFVGLTIFLIKNNSFEIYFGNNRLETKYHKKYKSVVITDVAEIVEDVLPSIVSVTSASIIDSGKYGIEYSTSNGYTKGAGSGIIIGKNDNEYLILTNYHVIDGANKIKVRFLSEESFDATVKGVSKGNDIAVLSVSKNIVSDKTKKVIKVATTGYSGDLEVGEGIIAIGNALGYGEAVTTGVISALDRQVTIEDNTLHMMQIDASINSGNSGGALVNQNGEVVGVVTAKYADGMGLVLPITDISSVIVSLMNGDTIDSIDLGIEGYIINDENKDSYHMPEGFYISKITSGSIASNSLTIGNIITEIDGNVIKDMSDITKILSKKKKNDTIKMKIKYVDGIEYKEKDIILNV